MQRPELLTALLLLGGSEFSRMVLFTAPLLTLQAISLVNSSQLFQRAKSLCKHSRVLLP